MDNAFNVQCVRIGVWVPRTCEKPYAAACICNSSMLTEEIGGRDRQRPPRGSGSSCLVQTVVNNRDPVSNKVEGLTPKIVP